MARKEKWTAVASNPERNLYFEVETSDPDRVRVRHLIRREAKKYFETVKEVTGEVLTLERITRVA